jgi:hypothetical protein
MSHTKITKIQKYCDIYKMDSLSKALADLHVQDRPNITATAKKHGLSRSKLSRHWNDTQSPPTLGAPLFAMRPRDFKN